ncbi:MAG: hypothetical protein OJF51_000108 [Nitrospira sp.]|jgi:hypothetical protein|nr:MAG: hypothetical protein OJF51_000108 [Nitrospira sp.]
MTSETDNFSWLIKARTSNQEALLRLYRLNITDNSNPVSQQTYTLLVGAGFSLWRAAFLSDVTRETHKIAEDARKLIKRLIQDNSVGYPQDRETREWMAGYYINNAIWRLLIAWKFIKEEANEPTPQALVSLKDFDERGAENESPVDLWNSSHEALCAILHILESRTQQTKALE